jgi:hypothetical protein
MQFVKKKEKKKKRDRDSKRSYLLPNSTFGEIETRFWPAMQQGGWAGEGRCTFHPFNAALLPERATTRQENHSILTASQGVALECRRLMPVVWLWAGKNQHVIMDVKRGEKTTNSRNFVQNNDWQNGSKDILRLLDSIFLT